MYYKKKIRKEQIFIQIILYHLQYLFKMFIMIASFDYKSSSGDKPR